MRLLLIALAIILAHAAQDPEVAGSEEVAALLGVKELLVDEFGHTNDWSASDSSPCSWTGIQCDDDGFVSALNLGGKSLNGSLSGLPLARLRHLVNISLEQNNLAGPLPPELSLLPRLRFLNISHNNFGYGFPANLSAIATLEVLDTYNNNFSGPLPPELGALQSIRHLHLGGSYFSGAIPPELGNLTTLRYLALSGNSLTGRIPPELGNLGELEELYLGYYNEFEGGIPREIGKLANLVRIDLGFCGLTGRIPAEIGNLSRLDSIFLQINNLSGPIPAEIGLLSALKSLDLSNNLLSGPIPDELAMLESIALVNLFRNRLSGSIPSFFGDLPNLEVLQLWANNLTGSIPPQLGQASLSLMTVDLSSNSLSGSIPDKICWGGALQVLILYGNQIGGALPESLGQCNTLVRVRLGHNQLTGGLPKNTLGLPNLRMLELLDNRMDGIIADAPVSAVELELLDLSQNRLRGSIPRAIGNLTNLKNLLLGDNRISGRIPASIGMLQQLSVLDASGNAISGEIPRSIGSCVRLSSVDLSRNQLVGAIPGELAQLKALDALNVSRNGLSGEIPRELEEAKALTSADFSYNRLFGPIPSQGQFGFFNESSFAGNLGLCGAPTARNCSVLASPRRKPRSARDRAVFGWLFGSMFLAALLVGVFGTFFFVRKYKECITVVLFPGGGKGSSCGRSRRRPWKLTAFQKLDFSAADILDCLSEDNVIGRGGSGTVYKAMMRSGELVAVKRLASCPVNSGKRSSGSRSSHDDFGFSAEVQTLGKIRHMNIVKLLGFCSNHETNLLVYEYMPNGSLGEVLHGVGTKACPVLDWETRYKVAVQAANGLCYLHHDCSPLIVHRDVKSNNILLDSNLRAHVADFGLAKLFQGSDKSESMSSVAGSYGYIAPEYAYTLKVNEKSDIYSFGVVLLELVTGRRPIEPGYGDEIDIVKWVRKMIQTKDGVLAILDPRMGSTDLLPLHEVMLVLRVALLCSSDQPAERPAMRDVVQMLYDVKPKVVGAKDHSSSRELSGSTRMSSGRLIDV
ncbi:leucine-rich repeat receptor-like serine/threonine-protein kinase BAM2 [Selaginella moellendorffii]|uniref:leucine-rich repeat receptor-like serine/threonine-protein kinase BAM2 n=1 Tax=Selaginella moellendorffii TaxID=88036 RepID=UPI000D1C3813|nr:leucine-rich repeat receptor-like serine/threonine-protein kinase BAM2 [Selaginella moellendorffii]|eukprot:XP_024532303.1 leucine-rich repeat receptor-like serine/threonine-protein kinase BAM2 [Selaginella moellendorffii]